MDTARLSGLIRRRQVSGSQASFHKFVCFGAIIFPFGLGAVVVALKASWLEALPFALVSIFGLVKYRLGSGQVDVAFDDDHVYLSDAKQEIAVPWSQVEQIIRLSGSPYVRPHYPVHFLTFRTPTAFGTKVRFTLPLLGDNSQIIVRMQERLRLAAPAFPPT